MRAGSLAVPRKAVRAVTAMGSRPRGCTITRSRCGQRQADGKCETQYEPTHSRAAVRFRARILSIPLLLRQRRGAGDEP
jgi:hypothetical protein